MMHDSACSCRHLAVLNQRSQAGMANDEKSKRRPLVSAHPSTFPGSTVDDPLLKRQNDKLLSEGGAQFS